MANAIDILIRAIWQGGSETTKAQRDLRGLGPAGKEGAQGLETVQGASRQTGSSLGSLALKIGVATAALGAVSVAAKRAFDRLEAGAGLELTAQRFERLAVSVDSTAVALRTDLLTATEGMLSTSQAMALATDLIGLGLADTHDEAVRLGRVVSELDADMGELTLALANQTTRRFDQLGISLEGFNERLAFLKQTMNDEDAFSMAFLEQAEAQIERVGGVSQTTAGDIRRLQADWAALNEEIDIFLAKEFGPILAALSGRTGREFEERAQAAAAEAENVEDLRLAYRELKQGITELAEVDLQASAIAQPGFEQGRLTLLRGLAEMTDSAEEFEREANRIFGPRGFSAAMRLSGEESAEAFFNSSKALQEAASADQVLIAAHQRLVEENKEVVDSFDDVDEVLQRVQVSMDRYAQQLAAIESFESRREGIDASSLVAEQNQEQLAADFELLQDRADLFEGFQESMTSVTEREEAQRLQITEQHEARRTDIIENFNQQRAQEEEDFQRARQRQEEQLARDIAGVQEDTSERQAQLRDDANRRIAELEEEHLKRITDITRDADLQLQEAAGRLDATAVHQIAQQRDRALEEETDRYEEQREDILEELDRRLQLEQEAAEERIRELNEFHDRRQAQEDADRAIRLQREQEAHDRQLSELDDAHAARLAQLQTAAQDELSALGQKYEDEHELLTASGAALLALQQEQQDELLAAEEAWWNERLGLISGASGGATALGGTTGASGGGQGFPGSAPYVGASAGNASLSIGEINVNTAPGQDAEEVGGEVVRQIDRYMINLMAGGP